MKLKWLIGGLLLLLASFSFAFTGVTYTSTSTANIIISDVTYANLTVLNNMSNNSGLLTLNDCGLFTCRLYINVTP